jgi:cholesterol transport system auxiliary component
MKRTPFPLAMSLTLLAPLAACVSFGEKPPASLLTLSATTQLPAGSARPLTSDNSIIVYPPTASQMLSADRVAVRTGDTSIAYLKDARWSEAPSRLFADLLSDTIAARTDRVVIDRRQYALAPGARLSGKLEAFELLGGRGEVVVVYDAVLVTGEGKPPASRRFEARAKAASEKPGPVGRALNEAANQVAVAVADWVKAGGV